MFKFPFFSYWANHGGDCANFVSQCLITGGHPYLNQGGSCRGYPCGKEEIGAKNLGDCLSGTHGWKRTCGYHQTPPSGVKKGDVVIYHKNSCSDYSAHATIVVNTNPVRISSHSSSVYNEHFTYFQGGKPYIEYLQYQGNDGGTGNGGGGGGGGGSAKTYMCAKTSVNIRSSACGSKLFTSYQGQQFEVVRENAANCWGYNWVEFAGGKFAASSFFNPCSGTRDASDLSWNDMIGNGDDSPVSIWTNVGFSIATVIFIGLCCLGCLGVAFLGWICYKKNRDTVKSEALYRKLMTEDVEVPQ